MHRVHRPVPVLRILSTAACTARFWRPLPVQTIAYMKLGPGASDALRQGDETEVIRLVALGIAFDDFCYRLDNEHQSRRLPDGFGLIYL